MARERAERLRPRRLPPTVRVAVERFRDPTRVKLSELARELDAQLTLAVATLRDAGVRGTLALDGEDTEWPEETSGQEIWQLRRDAGSQPTWILSVTEAIDGNDGKTSTLHRTDSLTVIIIREVDGKATAVSQKLTRKERLEIALGYARDFFNVVAANHPVPKL